MKKLLAVALAATVSVGAFAQAFPAKPITFVVPFAAGGVQDILARAVSTELGTALGQTVIVENRPGAGGTVGTAYVAKAAPDSSIFVMAAASHNIAGSLYSKLAYDPQKDFAPVAHIGSAGYVLMINPEDAAAYPTPRVQIRYHDGSGS